MSEQIDVVRVGEMFFVSNNSMESKGYSGKAVLTRMVLLLKLQIVYLEPRTDVL
jgi:hypothetical protein